MKLAEMPKYVSYRDSGVVWLGEIPSHWTEYPLCSKTKLKSITNRPNEQLLSVYLEKGVIRFEDVNEKRTNATSQDLSNYQLVQEGDFVLNNQQAWRGSVGVSFFQGIVSPAYLVLSLSTNFDTKYANYLFRDPAMVAHYLINSKGVGTIQRNLYWQQLKRAPVFLPSINEQTLIANFLDQKTAQIDQAVAIKEKQIELLKERNQIIIQEAVTQGLDPTVPMKESGADWIGKIPLHWSTDRSRWLFKQRKEKARKGDEQLTASQKLGVIPQQKFMEIEGRRVTQVEFNSEILKHVEANDFVISMRSFQGGIEYCPYIGSISSAYVPLIPRAMVHAPYFKYLLKSNRYIEALQSTSNLVRDGQALRYENFCMVDLPIVPLEEQREIANYIDRQINFTEQSIELSLRQIQKLKEYKTTLVNSAVTGKVRITPEMIAS